MGTKDTRPLVEAGFTLLEMVLVLFLVGLMASATLMLTENVEDQAKYDATKQRMDIMRKAIVGDPTRTVNGSPEISGFVSDMGRLPECVRELLEQTQCDGSPLSAWSIDTSTGISSGWRGPYIQVLPERNGELRFRDGYGNSDVSDAQNSGWLAFDVSGAEISVSSDSFSITDTSDDIKANPLLVATDWQLKSIDVNFINQNTSEALPSVNPLEVLLRVYLSGSDYDDADDLAGTGSLTMDANAALANGGTVLKTFVFNSSTAIPTIGRRGYAIVCYEIPPGNSDNYIIFDGDCNSASNAIPSASNIKPFTVVPRQNIKLDWIIK